MNTDRIAFQSAGAVRKNKPERKQPLVDFTTDRFEFDTITKIVDRAWAIDWLRKSYASKLDMQMDVTAVHCNGNPLRLEALLEADEFNFAHDMSGICNCLDRETGQLGRNFSPRLSQRA